MATANIFDTIPEDHLDLFDNQQPRYNRIAKFLKFKKNDISKATGLSLNSVRWDDKMPPELKERIQEWAILFNLVAGHFGGDAYKTYLWFTTLNPLLGNVAPRDMIRFGRFRKLYKFVLNSLAENK